MPVTLLIVDDHPICTTALTLAARAVDPTIEVMVAGSLHEAETLGRAAAPALVLLDLMLPDVQGFAGLALMRALLPKTAIAIVSSRDQDATIRQAIALGARGFIPKSAPIDQMIAAIRVLIAGGQWFPEGALLAAPDNANADQASARIGELSVAQLRVLRAIAAGAQNKQIAYDLDLAIPTIKTHLAAIFRKLQVSNRTQAVLALRAFEDHADAT